jgi:hypothetical protein
LFASSCTKKKIAADESILGLDYYPTTQGKYVIYDVDSIGYRELEGDTIYVKYRVKEKIADSFTDNEGLPAMRLERYIKMFNPLKSYDSIPWTIREVWMINADKKSIQVSERDVRYTKLIFPIQENASWNGNAKNTIGEWDYSYKYIDKKETFNNNVLEKVLYVKQKDFYTHIEYPKYVEKYAKGIGLVYREMQQLFSNKVTSDSVQHRIESGFIYKQTLVSHGTE